MYQLFQWIISFALAYVILLLALKLGQKIYQSSYHHKASHLILITQNNQRTIEGFIRSYMVAKRMDSKNIRITVVDTGSTDDTLKILKRIRFKIDQLEVISLQDTPNQEEAIHRIVQSARMEQSSVLVLDLRNSENQEEQEKTTA